MTVEYVFVKGQGWVPYDANAVAPAELGYRVMFRANEREAWANHVEPGFLYSTQYLAEKGIAESVNFYGPGTGYNFQYKLEVVNTKAPGVVLYTLKVVM